MNNRAIPAFVLGLRGGIAAIAAGKFHTCAVRLEGGVNCWGLNDNGQLGDTTTTEQHVPVRVKGLTSRVVAIAAGDAHTCVVTDEGGVRCWGDNTSGQLGDGTTTARHAPVRVNGLTSGIAAVAAGSFHSCALNTAGGVKCWGDNSFGQIGDGTTTRRHAPVAVLGLTSGVDALDGGNLHSCAAIAPAVLKCWGINTFGQLGDGTLVGRHAPVRVKRF
jgi:alpha-tubulin suppressor-like RCC1 family protein